MNEEDDVAFIRPLFEAHAAAMWRSLPSYERASNSILWEDVEREKNRICDDSIKLALMGTAAPSGPRPSTRTRSMWGIKLTRSVPKSAAKQE